MFNFKTELQNIVYQDVETLVKKDAEYGSSWKKRGGVGAFMMLARKWDRLETQITTQRTTGIDSYDIFGQIEAERNLPEGHTESLLETIRDLRRYLLLVESEIERRRGIDNNYAQHAPIVDTEDRVHPLDRVPHGTKGL